MADGKRVVLSIFCAGTLNRSDGGAESGSYRGGERPTPQDVHRWLVYALDLETGETRWRTEVHAGVPASSHHLKNPFASETPVTDGERLYVLFGNVGLYAFGSTGRCSGRVTCPRQRPATSSSTTRSSPTSRP